MDADELMDHMFHRHGLALLLGALAWIGFLALLYLVLAVPVAGV